MEQWNVPAPRIPGLDMARVVMLVGALVAFDLLAQPYAGWFSDQHSAAVGPTVPWGFLCTLLVVVIPGFFVISGYLASGLLQRAKFRGFLVSRLKRIVPLLALGMLVGVYSHFWVHLLPLYFLVICTVVAVFLSWVSRRVSFSLRSRLSVYTNLLDFGPAWIGGYGLLIALASGSLEPFTPTLSWPALVDWHLGVYSYLNFSVGWMLHRAGSTALKRLANCALIYLVFGAVVLSVAGSLPSYLTQPAMVVGGFIFAFALIGGFLAFGHRNNSVWVYLANAGLWVYVWQPILVVLTVASGPIARLGLLGLPAWALLPIDGLTAAVLLLAIFQLAIHRTPLRHGLSGRRRLRTAAPSAVVGEASPES